MVSAAMPRSRPRRFRRPLLVGLIVVGAIALLVALDKVNIQNPTEGSVGVHVVNDTGRAVHITVCENLRCTQLAPGGEDTAAGESFLQNVSPNSRVPFVVRSLSASGVTGSAESQCRLLVVGDRVLDRYRLSQLQPCRAGVTPSG